MMFRITPSRSAPVLRQAATGKTARARAAKEFPGEKFTVAALGACELASMQNGMYLPVSARAIVAAYRARQAASKLAAATREKATRGARKVEIARAAREAEREEVRAEKLAQKKATREAALKAKRSAASKLAAAGKLGAVPVVPPLPAVQAAPAVPVAQALPAAPEASGDLPANWDEDDWDGLSAPWA